MKTILFLSMALTSTMALANTHTLAEKYQGLYELTSCKDVTTGKTFKYEARTTIQINVKSDKQTKTTSERVGDHTILDIVANTKSTVDHIAENSSNQHKSGFFTKDITTYTTVMNAQSLTYKEVSLNKDRLGTLSNPISGDMNSGDSKSTIKISTNGSSLVEHSKYETENEETIEHVCTYKKI